MSFLTLFDCVEHLIVSSFGGPQDAEQRDIRVAIQRAYQEITQIRDWSFYHVHGRVVTDAPYTAGTIEMTDSDSVVLTGGSFATAGMTASNAKDWTIRIGARAFPVKSYDSSTTLTVELENTESVPAGTGYVLYRMVYPLPEDLRNMDEPSNEFFWWSGIYLTPDEAMKVERVNYRSGFPLHWTIIKDPHSSGWAIKLVGYPIKRETIDFTYRRKARGIRYSGHETAARAGTITVSGTSVTGSSTTFASAMAGSILRVGDTSAQPGPIESLNPYVSEAVISSVGSSTALTIGSSLTVGAGTKYLITDPIDIPSHMHNVMLSGAEYWLARIRDNKPDKAFAMYQRDLRLAMEQDVLAPASGRSKEIWADRGWRSPLQPDGGT
jgi:hypothetical protein